jgi:hypothetical protein
MNSRVFMVAAPLVKAFVERKGVGTTDDDPEGLT